MKKIIGIDEVGRGPVAGPVVICAVCISDDFYESFQKKTLNIKDSKKLNPKKRIEWLNLFKEMQKEGHMNFSLKSKSAKEIDRQGISNCLKLCIKEALEELKVSPKDQFFLDGSLKAPKKFLNQETIIKGDEKNSLIATASIIAKVFRDTYMEKVEEQMIKLQLPNYQFAQHKGYGTKKHLELIKKYGSSKYHRKSFLH